MNDRKTQAETGYQGVAHSSKKGMSERQTDISLLFEEHNQALIRFISTRLHSPQEVKEIAQESYVKLLSLDEQNAVSYLRAYLFRIAANLINDRLKQRERRLKLRDLVFFDFQNLSPPPEIALSAWEELEKIQQAIAELPPKCRKAFLLHKVEEMAVTDVAREMNLSIRMVRLYIARAIAHCREVLSDAS